MKDKRLQAGLLFVLVMSMLGCARLIEIPENSLERRPQGASDGIGGLRDARESFLSHFKIQVFTAKEGLDLDPAAVPKCEGTIDGKLLSNSQLIFPEADFKCRFNVPVLGEKEFGIPIAKLMNPPDVDQLPSDALVPTNGKYVGVQYTLAPTPKDGSAPLRMKMTPPAPFILGPIISQSSDFSGYGIELPIRVDTSYGISIFVPGKTFVGIKVLQTGLSYTLPDGSYTFTDVISWVRYASGYEDLPSELKTVPPMLGIKELQFNSSTKPLAFTQIRIILDVKSLVAFGALKLLATWFTGETVIIKLSLLSHREL